MPESLTRKDCAAKITCKCPASRRNRVRLQIGMVSGFDWNRVRHPVGITVRHHSESSAVAGPGSRLAKPAASL
jgi:hypothetical protein